MQNEKSYSQISIKLRYLYSIIMVLWNRCRKIIFEFVLNFNHWNIKSWIFNVMMKTIASLISMSYSNVCSRAQETTRWLWKQPSNYSFRWESPQNLTLEMRWWKLAPSVLVVCIYSVSSKRSNIKSEDDKGKLKQRNTRFWS